jgi:hypothetical protein
MLILSDGQLIHLDNNPIENFPATPAAIQQLRG